MKQKTHVVMRLNQAWAFSQERCLKPKRVIMHPETYHWFLEETLYQGHSPGSMSYQDIPIIVDAIVDGFEVIF